MSQASNRASIMLRRPAGRPCWGGALEHAPIPRIEAGQVGIIEMGGENKASCCLVGVWSL